MLKFHKRFIVLKWLVLKSFRMPRVLSWKKVRKVSGSLQKFSEKLKSGKKIAKVCEVQSERHSVSESIESFKNY